MRWTFHLGDLDSGDVRQLLSFHFEAMRASSPPEACHVLPGEGLRNADIRFWSLRENGRLLGIGALKQLAPGHGEVKSMRTMPDQLGRGVGKTMLDHIVTEARKSGYERLSLETGSTEPFAAALHLYRREGFLPSGAFGGYRDTPFTRFFSRTI